MPRVSLLYSDSRLSPDRAQSQRRRERQEEQTSEPRLQGIPHDTREDTSHGTNPPVHHFIWHGRKCTPYIELLRWTQLPGYNYTYYQHSDTYSLHNSILPFFSLFSMVVFAVLLMWSLVQCWQLHIFPSHDGKWDILLWWLSVVSLWRPNTHLICQQLRSFCSY